MKRVQMVFDNYDIKQNPDVVKKYPLLYKEVQEHDRISTSSWYTLSDSAYTEYLAYFSDHTIGYIN